MKQVVAAAHRALGEEGLAPGTQGSASVADHASGILLVTGVGMPARESAPEGVAEVAIASGARAAGPLPTPDLAIHLALARAGHGAVVLAHAPHAAAVGLVRDAVPCVLVEQGLRVGGATPVLAGDAPGSDELAAAVAAVLVPGGVRACVVRHTCLVATAPDAIGALAAAIATEEGARTWLLALAAGTPAELDPEAVSGLALRAGIVA